MPILFYSVFAALIVVADQVTKYLTVMNIAPQAKTQLVERLIEGFHLTKSQIAAMPKEIPAIDGVFHFSHMLNDGAAWSSFSGMRWLFVGIFAAFTVGIVWEYKKKSLGLTKFEWWCIAAIYGGGLGNIIDRVRFGFVIDMVEVEFIQFPVFNVADCFITCGCIALIVHLIFFNKGFWKDNKK